MAVLGVGWCLLLLCLAVMLPGANGQGTLLRTPSALAYDSAGNLFIADTNGHRVLEATLGGALLVIAGNGVQGFGGDGGPATGAELNEPQGLSFGRDGTLYIADTGNARVRAVGVAGVITTIAGSGRAGFSGDGGPATAASLRAPTALTVDGQGNLWVCDTGNHRLRRISGGVITTVAGNGIQGFSGDGGPAVAAELDSPLGVVVAGDGRIFVADSHNERIRVIGTDGSIATFAGTGARGFAGDGGPATSALLSGPRGLALTSAGDLLVADAGNQRLRQVSSNGTIGTVTGSGREGSSADASAPDSSALRAPRAVALSSFGLPVVADTLNGTVRVLAADDALFQPAALVSGRLSTLATQAAASQTYGQTGAAVRVTGSAGEAQGRVELLDAGAVVAHASLNSGIASFDLSSMPAGAHHLTINYLGDGLNPAASDSASLSVSPLNITIAANPATVPYGAPLPVLSGALLGVLPQDAGQVNALFSTTAGDMPPVGSFPITAVLTGAQSGNYTLSMAANSGTLQVVPAASMTALASPGQSYQGFAVRLTATVAPSARGAPTGTVQFFDGASLLATATVVNGSASGTYTPVSAGVLNLTARYGGDANFLGSTSAMQVANIVALPDFLVAPAATAEASTTAGGTATYSLNVSAQSGPFTGAIALSASGFPSGATVSFSPPEVIPGTGSAGVTMTVQIPASVGVLRRPTTGPMRTGLAMALGGFGFGMFGLRGRGKRGMILLGVTLFLAGCGARTVGDGATGLTVTRYTLQVTGTGTNLAGKLVTHSTNLTLKVQ